MNLNNYIDKLYVLSPKIYNYQLNFFNGNHLEILKKKLKRYPTNSILEIGCGPAPILDVFKPNKYTGIDIDNKFINLANKLNKNKNYSFYQCDAKEVKSTDAFDILLFSHTTHHLSDAELQIVIKKILKIKFKYLIVYDGRPIGFWAPLLLRLDYHAAKFRKAEEFIPIFQKNFIIDHLETFHSNRSFYEYPLIIMHKKSH